MPFFAEDTLQAIREIPLYDIVRTRVELSRSGQNWRGLSPFSNERTPSFYVITEKNFFKCHSTGLAGDGIRFIQETEKLNFSEAIEVLAERFNIPVRYSSGGGPDPAVRNRRQALFDINHYAREHFHDCLTGNGPDAEQVLTYWTEKRGFSLEHAREFQIGLSPVHGDRLLQLLLRKGFDLEAIAESGLFHAGRNPRDPKSWYPVFQGRLMIPIQDIQGNTVAFTARQLDLTPQDHPSWKAKYINSPETPIFKKGSMLFHMDVAKEACRSSGRFLLVEGQLDALRCHAVGLLEAVAPQGTSITEGQLALLKRYSERLDVLLDSDAAGVRAVLRLIPMALKARLEVQVYSLPEGSDPDDFLRVHGKGGLDGLKRLNCVSFMAKALLPEDASPESRARVLEEILATLVQAPNAAVVEAYLPVVADAVGVSEHIVRTEFQQVGRSQRSAAPTPVTISQLNPVRWLTNAEGDLIWAVLQNVRWAHSLAYIIDHQWIRKQTTEGRLLDHILNLAILDQLDSISDILSSLESDEARDCFAHYRVEERSVNSVHSVVNNAVQFLFKQFCRETAQALNQELIRMASGNSEPSLQKATMERIRELNRQRLQGPFPVVVPPVATA